ncbi:putative DNA-binding protein (MmcQ/YjbR family) [Caulobacter ginsengisoli]|uniref:DNA-binding protein (MmcQ/YjbR family) n=1 Tax=Caulobacter ginsengisoli TaxID=400775 RepID=A0ABU0IQZ7_9CAUL|nr:MmcQ/YjbR family DNA-binding protein [Caulobacter ginsengisoli]MDQ0464435.1 putative DNA-binding protein (MmcQ/YjbR family) [Caulobacter ginsengisoli]
MTPAAFDKAARALTGATMNVQWGEDQVYKIGGKMFAVLGPNGSASFKASDIAFEALTETGPAIPAPYLARAKWVYFADIAPLDDAEVEGWLANAHALIAAKLTKKLRAELGL